MWPFFSRVVFLFFPVLTIAQMTGNGGVSGNVEFSAVAGERAFQADTFADSVGFATHVNYNDAPSAGYPNGNYSYTTAGATTSSTLTSLTALLQASGIRHIRDGWASDYTASSFVTRYYGQMCAAGIKQTLLMANQPTRAGLNTFAGYLPGCVEAWEGANECDGGGNTCATAVSWLPAMLASAKDLGIPALGLSNASGNLPAYTGKIQSLITAQNLHTYRDNNQNPEDTEAGNLTNEYGYGYSTLSWWITNSRKNAINLPVYVTEVGYKAAPTPGTGEISEATQAKYLARTLLWNYMAGIKRTFLYEFFDEGSSADYGVVHSDLSVKPAYTYLKNLVLTLTDRGPAFQPGKLVYTLTGGDGTLRHLLFQKRDGSFYLVLWRGVPGWSGSAAVSVAPAALNLTVSGRTLSTRSVFSDTGGVTSTALNGTTASLSVTDHLTIIRVN